MLLEVPIEDIGTSLDGVEVLARESVCRPSCSVSSGVPSDALHRKHCLNPALIAAIFVQVLQHYCEIYEMLQPAEEERVIPKS